MGLSPFSSPFAPLDANSGCSARRSWVAGALVHQKTDGPATTGPPKPRSPTHASAVCGRAAEPPRPRLPAIPEALLLHAPGGSGTGGKTLLDFDINRGAPKRSRLSDSTDFLPRNFNPSSWLIFVNDRSFWLSSSSHWAVPEKFLANHASERIFLRYVSVVCFCGTQAFLWMSARP